MSQDRFNNEKYIDWVKLKLSLQYAKEGLTPVTEQKVQAFFNSLSSTLQTPSSSSAPAGPTLCNTCVKVDRKKQWSKKNFSCVSGICDRCLNFLQQNHVNPTSKVEWDNVDVSRLPVSPWECAKLYLPYGSGHIKGARDADLAAILTLYRNCRFFALSLQDVTLCKKVKDVRNNLLHSGTMEVENADMLFDVRLVKQLLKDPAFAADQSCKDAIVKIDKLVQNKLELSLNKELELQVLNREIEYVAGRTDQLNQDMTGLTNQLGAHITEVNKEVTGLTDQLGKHRTEVNKEVTEIKDQLGKHKAEVSKEVTGLKDQLVTHVTEVNKEVTGLKDQFGKHKIEVGKEVTSVKDKLEATIKDIDQLQNFASLLCSFIEACQIESVDMKKLASNLRTLSNLRAETERHGQTLAQLQDTVSHHGVTLEKHEQSIDQVKQEQLSQKRKLHSIESDIKAKKAQLRSRPIEDIAELQDAIPRAGTSFDSHRSVENIIKRGSTYHYLITIYKNDCRWENPTTGDEDKKVTISQMYVQPDMKLVRQRDDNGGLVAVQQKQPDESESLIEIQQRQGRNESMSLSYRQLFYTGTEQCTDIYITGDAGMGKTTFCKQLVNTWCEAIENIPEEGGSNEDLRLLKEFSILFYVNLREAESHYHIEDMIRETVLPGAPTEYDVHAILKTEKCLIVVDGLDEWSCPPGARLCRGLNKEIPGRNAMNKNCTYLTTTRNWKFDVIDLKSKHVDKHVELCGIGEKSSWEFAENVVRQLDPKAQGNRQIKDFFSEVEQNNLYSLTIVPVLLTQLLTLWYFFKDIGKSQVQLYCKMLDLLLEQAKKHLSETTSTVTKPTQTDVELPKCFKEEYNCCNHTQLLLCLSELAFSSLLNKKKEDSLVFNSSKLNVYRINELDIILCLKSGIFTQSKVLSNPTGKFKKYSFLHKKLQEFLAAVYLVTSDDLEKNMSKVIEYCDTLDTTLEMGPMFEFVCGMKAEVGNQLLEHLASVVEGDKRVQNYRQSVSFEPLIRNIQVCQMNCATEGARNGLIINVHLQDYWLDRETMYYYVNHVEELKHNSVKSVYIDSMMCEYIEYVAVVIQEVHTLEKLRVEDIIDRLLLATVINNNVGTLKSLSLVSADLDPPDVLSAAVLGCLPSILTLQLGLGNDADGHAEMMEMLELKGIFMEEPPIHITFYRASLSHGQMEQLLPATTHLTQLHLQSYCTDHRGKCSHVIDLSAHTQLQSLKLWCVSVTNLHVVVHNVKIVDLRNVTVTHGTLRLFIEALAQSSNKVKVKVRLSNVTVTEDSANHVDLVAYIRGCDKFTVTRCDIEPDIAMLFRVHFHKD